MSWIFLGEFQPSKNWQFTTPVEGELFRVSHKLNRIDTFNKQLARGVLAQGFDDGRVNIFKNQLFTYKEEDEILALYYPQGLGERSLCFKRLDDSADEWSILVEVFQGTAEENLNNYLTARFGANVLDMALYPRLYSGSLDVESKELKLVAGQAKKIVDKNLSRTGLKVITTGHAVLLATGFDADGKPTAILDKVPPNYNYEKEASSAGIYQGEVWAFSEEETYITTIENSAK